MNTKSPVGALAVMELVASGEEWRHLVSFAEMLQARAAVAELVSAARHFRRMHDAPDAAGTALDAALAKFA